MIPEEDEKAAKNKPGDAGELPFLELSLQNLSVTITPGVIVTPNAMVQCLKAKVRSPPEGSCTPPNLLDAEGRSIGVDTPPDASGVSFGETPIPHQLQLGETGSDHFLSRTLGPTARTEERERTGGAIPIHSVLEGTTEMVKLPRELVIHTVISDKE